MKSVTQILRKFEKEAAKIAVTPEQVALILEAEILGKMAFDRGGSRASCQDRGMEDFLARHQFKIGEAMPYLKAWVRGWDNANLCAPY